MDYQLKVPEIQMLCVEKCPKMYLGTISPVISLSPLFIFRTTSAGNKTLRYYFQRILPDLKFRGDNSKMADNRPQELELLFFDTFSHDSAEVQKR